MQPIKKIQGEEVSITGENLTLSAFLHVPKEARGIVLFAHGTGSSRFSPRNQYVAKVFQDENIATLVLDLLTPAEEKKDAYTGALRFDIQLLAKRLEMATRWLEKNEALKNLSVGYFGASTGAAAALIAASNLKGVVRAVVSRGGRPDLATPYLPKVVAPTLLIVGEKDEIVLGLNQTAYEQLFCEKQLQVVPKATHLFEEPGALEEVARMAKIWFTDYL